MDRFIVVRLSGPLAQAAGSARIQIEIEPGDTVGDVLACLQQQRPSLAARLGTAVAVVGGRHVESSEPLEPGQEVAFLLPVAGGG